jgi:uncharacterized iron-regulated protein
MTKYKWIILTVCILVWVQCGRRTMHPETVVVPVSIADGVGLKDMSFTKLADKLAQVDAIFIGEIHNDSLTHVWEFELLKAVHRRFPDLGISMEMFERDVQPLLDGYLRGEVTELVFLEKSRPWKNYTKAYRPLVEFAREHGLPVLAMNVPRRYAGRIAMQGMLDQTALHDSEKVWVAKKIKILEGEYRDRFMKVLEDPGQPQAMARMNPENLYAAQCLKDDTMAESIDTFLQSHPDFKIVSYQGDFHSAFGLGIVQKLKLLNPSIRTAVISIVPVEDYPPGETDVFRGQGDYLIFVPRIEQD